MIGQCIDTQRLDGSIFIGGYLRLDVIVAPKAGAAQVLGTVLDPFHGLAGGQRSYYRAHVAGIDGYLVAETATDIRRDDANAVFRQTGDNGKQCANRVRSLRSHPERQLTRRLLIVGHAAAGLNGSWVNARDVHLLLNNDAIGLGLGGRP